MASNNGPAVGVAFVRGIPRGIAKHRLQASRGFLLPRRLFLIQAQSDEVSGKLASLRFRQRGEALFQVETFDQ
jgi:hypothetical protein